MSSYLRLIEGVKGVAAMLLPSVEVYIGTVDRISQESSNSDKPIIAINDNLIISQSDPQAPTKSTTMFIEFMLPDSPDSTSEEVRNILASTDILIDQFLYELLELYIFYGIEIGATKRAPGYSRGAATYTGFILEMSLQIGGCSINVFPDMQTYQNEIGRKISPYKWYGITQRA